MSDLGNKEIMSNNIQYYMAIKMKTRKEVCEACDIKYSTFCEWINAKKYPRIDKIEQMANYFHVTKADLVEEKQEIVPSPGEQIRLIYEMLDEERAQHLLNYANDLLVAYRAENSNS